METPILVQFDFVPPGIFYLFINFIEKKICMDLEGVS